MRRLVTPRWLARHALAAVLVAGCLGLGWWQLRRAAGGNALSWAYAVQWPVFAGFLVFIWVREIRRALGLAGPRSPRTGGEPARRPVLTYRPLPAVEDRNDPELAAYNHYLAWLNANPGARRGDYPGTGRSAEHTVEEETWAQPSSGTA
jgi:hypothetical protein